MFEKERVGERSKIEENTDTDRKRKILKVGIGRERELNGGE